MDYPHHTVAELDGSLPMGGSVARTPVHAFLHLPPALQLQARPAPRQQRRDIDLGGLLAFEIDNVLTPDEADALIAWSERLGYRSEAPGISTPPGMRMNKTVHWVADHALLGPIYQQRTGADPAATAA